MENHDRIVGATCRLVRVPVDPPRGDAIQKFDAQEVPLVYVTDGAGRTGVGFGYTIGTGGTAIRALLETELLPKLPGRDAREIVGNHEHLFKSIHALTPGTISSTALAAVDLALWDLAGKRANLPLYLLLGGAKAEIPIYNTNVGWLNRPLDQMLELSREAVEKDGFRALKFKVGKPDPEEDRERIARVRETVGPKIDLMIDANQSWHIDEAIRRLPRLEPYDLVWIEEPLLATDIEGYVALGKHTRIPRAGGESLYSAAYFLQYIRAGALDILQPDVARIGGITGAIEVCHLAKAANLRVAPHVSPELSVTVACAVSNSFYIEYIPQMEPILKAPVRREGGNAVPFDAAGHGIEFDEAALDRFAVKE